MSKKSKSKNSVVKKAKKFQRQGKLDKALAICDDFLDNEKLEESVIQIKVDILSDIFEKNNLSEKLTEYTQELNYFLNDAEELECLKIYNVFENLYQQSENFLNNPKALNVYLISGILIEPLESIIVMNELIKGNSKNGFEAMDETIPSELEKHKNNVKKVTYQYLGLYFDNPKEYIDNLEIDSAAILEKIMHTRPLENEEAEPANPDENEEIIEEIERIEPEKASLKMTDSEQLAPEEIEKIESEMKNLKKQVAKANEENNFIKAYKLQEKLIKTSKLINPTGVEIKELKEEIKEANEVENYRKALKLQKKLLKISKNKDILDSEPDKKTEQKTLFDDF